MRKDKMTAEDRRWTRENGLLIAGMLLCSTFIATAADSDNVRFHGTLIAKPCQLDTVSEDFEVSFGSVIDKGLYTYTRTNGVPFEIRLKECNTAIAKGVKVMFTGTESLALPGLLAVEGGNGSMGVAIGLETPSGEIVKMNETGELQTLNSGDTQLNLKAYVQGEPEAIRGRTIIPGEFRVTATFTLDYE